MLLTSAVMAQQQTQPTTAPADDPSFVSIFDGKSLDQWDGDTRYWRVENGSLVGEITAGNQIQQNSFIIWKGGTLKDFDLKLEYRITSSGNSGINYRSARVDGQQFVMRGYQFDIDGEGRSTTVRHTANNYDERGRTFMALRGQITRAVEGARQIIGTLGDYKEMTRHIKSNDWNQVHIIGRGNTLIHILNGQVMSVLIDDDVKNRALEGQLGVQVHTGPPMKVEYRNIRVKKVE